MFNLLPENLKEKIKSEYKFRFAVVVFLAVIFIQVSFLILLLPSWLGSGSKEKDAILETEVMNQGSLSKNLDSVSSIIKSTNTKLNILNTALEYPKLTPFISSIITNKNSSIRINEILYSSTRANIAAISLDGISNTREALVVFVKNLEKSGLFKVVDLPVGNLAKDKNINFSMNLTIEI